MFFFLDESEYPLNAKINPDLKKRSHHEEKHKQGKRKNFKNSISRFGNSFKKIATTFKRDKRLVKPDRSFSLRGIVIDLINVRTNRTNEVGNEIQVKVTKMY